MFQTAMVQLTSSAKIPILMCCEHLLESKTALLPTWISNFDEVDQITLNAGFLACVFLCAKVGGGAVPSSLEAPVATVDSTQRNELVC